MLPTITAIVVAGILLFLLISYALLYNRLRRLQIKVEEGSADIDVALEKRFDLLTEEIEAVKKFLRHEYTLFTDVTALRAGTLEEADNCRQKQEITEEALKTIDEQIDRQMRRMEKIKRQMQLNDRSKALFSQKPNEQRQLAGESALAKSVARHDTAIGQKINLLSCAHRDLANVGSNVDALAEQYPALYSWISVEHLQHSIYDSEEHLQAARRLYNANVSLYNQTLACIPWSVVAALCHMEKAPFYEIGEEKRNKTFDFN